jgi:hypothetical protein
MTNKNNINSAPSKTTQRSIDNDANDMNSKFLLNFRLPNY